MLRKLLLTVVVILVSQTVMLAQTGQGSIQGKLLDEKTGEPIPFANIVLERNGVQQAGTSTDMDGKYNIKPVEPGTYTLKASFVGYQSKAIQGIKINSGKISFVDVKLSSSVENLEEFEVVDYKVPLIEKDNTSATTTITKEDIDKMPTRGATGLAQTVGGVYSQDDGSGDLNIRGARSDANYYFIDGIKVRGSNNLPQSAIEEVSVITGGLPAQYGDVTGGVISITTRGPSKNYFGSVEYITSGYKIGDEVYGLDKFGYNLFEGSVSGPLIMKKDSSGEKTEPLVGFFLSGNVQSTQDQRPSITGSWKVKDQALAELRQDPLRYATQGTGAFQNADFLRLNNFEKVRTRPNNDQNRFVVNGKLDFNTGETTNLTFGGSYEWQQRKVFDYDYSLFNYDQYPEETTSTWRVFGRFTQRFNNSSDEDNESVVKNAYYTVQADYSQNNFRRWDANHQDNLWNYGYYGQFETEQARTYELTEDAQVYSRSNPDSLLWSGRAYLQSTFTDTLIGFSPSNINSGAAEFTSTYYELFGWQGYDENGDPVFDKELASDFSGDNQGGSLIYNPENSTLRPYSSAENFFLRSYNNIRQNGGFVNGDLTGSNAISVNDVWDSHATPFNSYTKNQRNQFRLSATGSADIKNHNISLGFEYEQRIDRSYGMAPAGMWFIGRLRTNSHLDQLNTDVGEIIGYSNSTPIINFERQNASPGEYAGEVNNDNQSFFDYNLRQSLGLDPDGNDFIDFNSLSPEDMEVEYFSANELLNNGSELVSYHGYDAYGNKINDNPSIDDFFNETDEYGNYTRPIPSFRPTYVAGWIQDKFAFDDLVFNVGLRIDRYDANQSNLVDPYVLFPTVRAGEQEVQSLAESMGEYTVPGNIGDDYVVYVDNVEDPSSIVGYRNEETWFDAQGAELADGSSLQTTSGNVAPLLVDKQSTSSDDINSSSFEDYEPQLNVMPRISFSFPISEEALFFAHYDVLTKRPGGNRLNPLDYYFLEQRTSAQRINNPALQPEQTIDYSVGFKQTLSKSSAMTIEAFYREMRNQIQLIGRQQAFPKTYTTFGNIDFGTVKGLTFSYDLRRTKNLKLRAAYTLQFAEGTGSTQTSAANLIRAGKQNIRSTTPLSYDQRHAIVATVDYRYGSGKDYNGPIVFDKPILKNTGANFQFNLGSGTPYSKQQVPTGNGLISGGGSPIIDGSINGSRLPWQFRVDARLDRDIKLKVGENNKELNLNVYLWVLNVLNTQNIINVYRATGTPDDDGYLNDPRFAQSIDARIDTQAFTEQYLMNVNNYYNYALPRRARIGVILSF
ncbi:MAG: carboxypeptidase-like regulatory domain-containing protein [Salibacter sp.]|uniref:carboxypeptidase-like regulatory domain-containing protein n=1 Tax=Salibacter sp. TaxID=2010995 RepID=UPI0028701B22|nr:carboxypeptidase-like regulatory domain-containing protein [Salibacter sp.]MDR9397825.1 carboxypeptidase-like regulatory domain-containing protein [Salibacter sp.]